MAVSSPILGSVMLSLPFCWMIAVLLGLVFGSFLNVCISRLPQHCSIVRPPSHCPHCHAPVRPRDNLPVVSWLLLRGRCRGCREPISVRYPLVEAGYAGLVAASLAHLGLTVEALAAAVFCFLALGLLVMDLETMLLPDTFTLPGLALGLLAALAGKPTPTSALKAACLATLAAAGWALLLLAIRWSYWAIRQRHGLGVGDVKLVAMLAAWLGITRMAVCFLVSVVAAAIFGLLLGAKRSSASRQIHSGPPSGTQDDIAWNARRIPLGAFLCLGGLYTLFFGEKTLTWYLHFWP